MPTSQPTRLPPNWKFREVPHPPVPASRQEALAEELGVHPLVIKFLAIRGLTDEDEIRNFLEPSINHLEPPFPMRDLIKGSIRLADALERGEKISIHGDYDVDGITSTTLLMDFLESLGATVFYHIPHRIHDGYGLSAGGVRDAHQKGATLLITVDCGTADHEEVALARSLGMDVIVVDHHLPDMTTGLPNANAIINPHRDDCGFAQGVLAAVGVVFHLVIGIRSELRNRGFFPEGTQPNLRQYLDLVALGTVADMVPLTGQNRILTNLGFKVIAEGRRPGLRALLVQQQASTPITSDVIGFKLAPTLNAAGRMGDGGRAVELLHTKCNRTAQAMAQELAGENCRRRKTDKAIFAQAMEAYEHLTGGSGADGNQGPKASPPGEEHPPTAEKPAVWTWSEPPLVIMATPGWHYGVLGIVASRVMEATGKAAVIIGFAEDGTGKGSARSIPGIHIGEALYRCKELNTITAAGGHRAAGGLSLNREQLDSFTHALHGEALNQWSETKDDTGQREQQFNGHIIDAELNLSIITKELINDLGRLEPFGVGNEKPVFLTTNLSITGRREMSNDTVRCKLAPVGAPRAKALNAVGFRMTACEPFQEGITVDGIYTPEWNDFRGNRYLQLTLRDVTYATKEQSDE